MVQAKHLLLVQQEFWRTVQITHELSSNCDAIFDHQLTISERNVSLNPSHQDSPKSLATILKRRDARLKLRLHLLPEEARKKSVETSASMPPDKVDHLDSLHPSYRVSQ